MYHIHEETADAHDWRSDSLPLLPRYLSRVTLMLGSALCRSSEANRLLVFKVRRHRQLEPAFVNVHTISGSADAQSKLRRSAQMVSKTTTEMEAKEGKTYTKYKAQI